MNPRTAELMSEGVDRLEPRRRPAGPRAGRHRWRNLLFLHWAVPEEQLRSRIPPQLELDLFEGRAYLGLVPFQMHDVRSRYWPWQLCRDFLETNVRTYVTYRGRPGIYFFSLDANSHLAVHGARLRWGLPYYYANIVVQSSPVSTFRYQLERRRGPGKLRVSYEVGPAIAINPDEPDVSRVEDFLIERYLLFVTRRGQLQVGQVHHPPYRLREAIVTDLEETLIAAAGLEAPRRSPDLVHWSPGVDVEVFSLRP